MARQRNKSKTAEKRNLKAVRPEYTLCYGMRLDPGTAPEQMHPHVTIPLPGGAEGEVALHVINGSLEEIREQLRESIETFFEIYLDREG
jgi:hypothetical protein